MRRRYRFHGRSGGGSAEMQLIAEELVAGIADLGAAGRSGRSLRDVLVHMIEEYARHCGHADLLRERIDGRVGQ